MGKGKVPLFFGNIEQVIPIYAAHPLRGVLKKRNLHLLLFLWSISYIDMLLKTLSNGIGILVPVLIIRVFYTKNRAHTC